MVDVFGHMAMALLWATPAWFLWDGRVSLTFVGLTVTTAMLPDIDLLLKGFLPVHHHGITHTVLFVTAIAVAMGAVLEIGGRSWLERQWLRSEGVTVSDGSLFLFVAGGFLLGGYSHLFADMLSAPDLAEPIEPFWPLLNKPWSIDLLWYSSPWWNEGLFLVALLLHGILASIDVGLEHPFEIEADGDVRGG